MKRAYDFLKVLSKNNNREWFNAHKDKYLEVKSIFDSFTLSLIDEISKFDNQIDPSKLGLKDCTYRIYRDIRFSHDKTPYKTHMGAFIVKKGKKSPYSGYYFHLEPFEDIYASGSILAVGLYKPESKIVQSIRDEIYVNGNALLESVNKAKGFSWFNPNPYKKVPQGFENVENPKWAELLKQKEFLLYKSLDTNYLFKDDKLLNRVVADFKKCCDFQQILNNCVDYALEGNI